MSNINILPPGEIIRDELKERGWTQDDLAQILGRPQPAVNEIIAGKRSITPQTAKELSAAFGTSPDFWLNLDSAYRLARAAEPADDIGRRAHLFAHAPIKEMEKRGWIKPSGDIASLESEYCRFFGVPSIESEPGLRVAARQSVSESALTPAQIAWCCRALHLAPAIQVAPYSKKALEEALSALRELAKNPESVRKVPGLLSSVGVRLIVIEHLPKTKIDGAVLWIEKAPIIVLSLRYDRIDAFWHTLQHEISHILEEDGQSRIDLNLIEGEVSAWAVQPEAERRANDQAAARLIPTEKLESYILRKGPLYSKVSIIQFANNVGVHPGIVVGQLQHRGKISWKANREMLVNIRAHIVKEALTDGFGLKPEVR